MTLRYLFYISKTRQTELFLLKFAATALFLILSLSAFSQEYTLKGRVIDKKTKEPLAFVNVVYGNPQRGTSTNIDGEFQIKFSEPSLIEFSYLGYHTAIVEPNEFDTKKTLTIEMEEKTYSLEQILVTPGYNPANEIIRKVYKNKKKNHPSSLNSFSYKSYNKMIFTFDTSAVQIAIDDKGEDRNAEDTTGRRLGKILEKQYLFLMETLSERKYQAPDKDKEYVKASRVSGFHDPSLVFLSTQFQSFSFYDDFITIGGHNYLNPITRNSHKKYHFNLEDTLYVSEVDSIFVISFIPEKGKNFNGLNGMLHINTNGYALQKAIAEPAISPDDFTIKIQQQYDYIEESQWFPSQLNTRIVFNNMKMEGEKYEYTLIGDGRTYIRDIEINPSIDPAFFDKLQVEIPDSAYTKSQEFWTQHRSQQLSEKEIRTYEMIDSLGEANNFDNKLKFVRMATTGYYPYRFLDIDYSKLLSYNQYEGLRIGFGAKTNNEISPWYSIGGYGAYGFKDKEFKYGGELQFFFDETKESKLKFSYQDDVTELGSYQFLMDHNFSSTEIFRDYLVEAMNPQIKLEAGFTFRLLNYLKVKAFVNQYKVQADEQYIYSNGEKDYAGNFYFSDAGIKLKYAYNERLIKTPWGLISEGTDYPVFYANITQGNGWFGGEFNNLRLEGRLSETFTTKNLGTTHINLMGGYATGEVPVFNMYNGNGSFTSDFALQIDNSFATMQLNEFFAQRFVSAFFRQDFGSLLFRSGTFRPGISLVSNIGWGWLPGKEKHEGIPMEGFDKGYFESGLLLDNLFSANFFSYGLGVYYRYGPYSFSKPADNFAYKLSFRINL
ncbi:MAG: DUF5686 family protein [Bacteroidales bacterium]